MLYMVEVQASMERGNEIDSKDGPGPVFAYIVERFKPQAIYGTPTRRQIFMVVVFVDNSEFLDGPLGDSVSLDVGMEKADTPSMNFPRRYEGRRNHGMSRSIGARRLLKATP